MLTNVLTLLGLITAALPAQARPRAQARRSHLVTARIEDRVVKTFDFDERPLGNYEETPMNWNRATGPGFPWFLEPRFDDEIGHAAPPSFRLALQGGNLGADYRAKDIPVRPSSDYRITAWVRPARLLHARASVSAYFLDHALRKIEASERRSAPVRGAGGNEPWTQATVELPGGFEDAAWIGLSCLVEQSDTAQRDPAAPRPIHYRDVHATAWFDDITVLRLPKVSLKMNAPGNLVFAGRPIECLARVADPDGVGLAAELEILGADHEILQTHTIPVVGVDDAAELVSIGDLPAGAYVARLSVRVGSREILQKHQAFLRLNADVDNPTGTRRGFGLILEPSVLAHNGVSQALLGAASPDVVKVPLWREDTDDQAIVRGDARLGRLLQTLRDLHITTVATLEAPPTSLAIQPGQPSRKLLDVLSSPAQQWRAYLALMLTRYGARIGAWQVGADADAADPAWGQADAATLPDDRQLAAAIANVRRELAPLVGSPDLVVPVSVQTRRGAEGLPADILALVVPGHISPDRLSAQLAAFDGLTFRRRWATIQPGDAGRYDRRSRLIALARSLLVARQSGADTVFVRQPWTIKKDGGDAVVSPDESLLLLRTLAQALGGLTPAGPVWIDHGVHAWLFADPTSGTGALVAWTDAEGTRPRKVIADVGPDAKHIDLWANVSDTVAVAGGRAFSVDAMPVIVAPVPVRRAAVLAGFAVDDPTFQAAVQEHDRIITLASPPDLKLRGTLRLEAPAGWRVRPRKVEIDLAGGESARIDVAFRVPNNQAVGDYVLVGRLAIEDEDLGDVTLRTPLHVGSGGLDVNILTSLTGRRLDILQRITNLTGESLNLRTFLIAPKMPFDTRLIANLAAGQTAVREYRIEDARHLAGRHIRLSVQQVGGPLKHNRVIGFD